MFHLIKPLLEIINNNFQELKINKNYIFIYFLLLTKIANIAIFYIETT